MLLRLMENEPRVRLRRNLGGSGDELAEELAVALTSLSSGILLMPSRLPVIELYSFEKPLEMKLCDRSNFLGSSTGNLLLLLLLFTID